MTSNIDANLPAEGNAYTSDVRANFATAASEIGTLQENAATDEANIATLQDDVATNTSDIAALQGNMTTAQTDITTAQADITALQTGSLPVSGGTMEGLLTMGATGILYPNGTNNIGFTWDGTAIHVWIDGTDLGTLTPAP
jgi:hypothetical protein